MYLELYYRVNSNVLKMAKLFGNKRKKIIVNLASFIAIINDAFRSGITNIISPVI